MRFFMIAAAMSVAALGFSGCATTGGCQSGGCGAAMVAGGCGDAGCTDCQSPEASEAAECSCGGGGCASCLSGIHGGAPGQYGGGLQNTGMAMTMFDRGPQCGGGGCGKFGCGSLGLCGGCRIRGAIGAKRCGSCDEAVVESESCDSCAEEVVEEAPSPGLLGRLKEANAIALAEQEAQFAAGSGCGCGVAGCNGVHGCGGRGCAQGCKDCARGILQHSLGQPYGGAVPHTAPPQGPPPAGMAPTYAYPYYTTRGPRDFLAREPASIGY